MINKRFKLILIAAILFIQTLLVPSIQAVESKKLNIVTSFYPMYAITKAITGDLQDVRMINSANGIHGYDPSGADISAIHDADLFIYHSVTLESWTRNIKNNLKDSNVKLVEASRELDMDKVEGLENLPSIAGKDEATLYDPHTWLDPLEAAEEAKYIATSLSEVDPAHADIYQNNAKEFEERAQKMVDKYTPIFSSLKQKTFVTQHTAFYYLSKRFGLTQLGISGISSEIEPTAKKISEIQEFVKKYHVKTIFVEPNVNTHSAEIISKATGAKIKCLSPLESDPHNNKSFLDNLEENLEILSQSLKEEGES